MASNVCQSWPTISSWHDRTSAHTDTWYCSCRRSKSCPYEYICWFWLNVAFLDQSMASNCHRSSWNNIGLCGRYSIVVHTRLFIREKKSSIAKYRSESIDCNRIRKDSSRLSIDRKSVLFDIPHVVDRKLFVIDVWHRPSLRTQHQRCLSAISGYCFSACSERWRRQTFVVIVRTYRRCLSRCLKPVHAKSVVQWNN
jgi:hypothetical protein